jgi:hypothetical protein
MPSLKCDDVQRALLETFGEHDTASLPPRIADHLTCCEKCAGIAEEQRQLDAALTAALAPPRLSPSFRRALYRRIDAPAPSSKSDALPDILHLASCAILTAASASMLPEYAPVIVAAGTIATVMSHLMLAVMRNTLDESAL